MINDTEKLRKKIRAAMVCEDREHLDSKDVEACYECQVDKVLDILEDQLIRQKTSHPSRNGWCCACEGDIAFAVQWMQKEPEFEQLIQRKMAEAQIAILQWVEAIGANGTVNESVHNMDSYHRAWGEAVAFKVHDMIDRLKEKINDQNIPT